MLIKLAAVNPLQHKERLWVYDLVINTDHIVAIRDIDVDQLARYHGIDIPDAYSDFSHIRLTGGFSSDLIGSADYILATIKEHKE